ERPPQRPSGGRHPAPDRRAPRRREGPEARRGSRARRGRDRGAIRQRRHPAPIRPGRVVRWLEEGRPLMSTPVGIDLGTTYSCVVHITPSGADTTIESADGKELTPSVV